jgi:Galactose oxidase, central domain
MSDPLDRRIRALVVHIAEASPPAPNFSEIVEREHLPTLGPPRPLRARRRRRWPRISIAVLLLVALGIGGAVAWNQLRSDHRQSGVVTQPPGPMGWRRLPAGPLEPRVGEATVWTGRKLIVWGGAPPSEGDAAFADGASYDTRTGRWHRIAQSPLQGRFYAAAVWTGQEMIITGGAPYPARSLFSDAAAYNPKTNRWRKLPAPPLAGRIRAVAVWTGRDVIIWGGSNPDAVPPQDSRLLDGAAYNPKMNTWQPIATSRLVTVEPTYGVWTGRELMIWRTAAGAAAYNPATNEWQELAPSPVTALGSAEPPVWTGTEFIVPGAQLKQAVPGAIWGGAYNQPENTWRPIAPPPLLLSCGDPISLWTGRVVLSFCSANSRARTPLPPILASYHPRADQWQTLDPPPAPVEAATGAWTGKELILWGWTHDDSGKTHAAAAAYRP